MHLVYHILDLSEVASWPVCSSLTCAIMDEG